MIQKVTRNAVYGMRNGVGGLWDSSLGRLGVQNPVSKAPWWSAFSRRPGLAALLSALSALAVAGIVLYLRKRRQVTEHYTMGENEGAWEAGSVRNSEST